MSRKNKKMYKSILKERNKPNPPPAKQETPASEGSLFSTLTQTIGQGMAFGAGSSMGHRAIDIMSGLWGGKEDIPKQDILKQDITKVTTFNECDDLRKEFVVCMQNSDHCNEVQSQYLGCLDKLNDNKKQ